MKRIGIGMIILGIMMIAGAVGLVIRNGMEEAQAARSAQELIVQMEAAVTVPATEESPTQEEEPDRNREMPAVRIDGYDYIGCLFVPALELELPVMEQWSYDRLRKAPCRYSGSLYRDDLVVMAHNYKGHFGTLEGLQTGDAVEFTDMEGLTVSYQVMSVEVLESGAVEEMTAGDWDLTLFTCTYGGQSRVTVRCDRAAN